MALYKFVFNFNFNYSLPDLHKSALPVKSSVTANLLAVTHKFKLIFIQHTVKYQQSSTHTLSLDAQLLHS